MQPILMVLDVTFPKNLAVSGGRLWFTDNDCAVGHVDARARYTWE